MPDGKHTSHCHIDPSAGFLILLSGKFQQTDKLRIYRNRRDPRVVIDGFDIADTIIIIINIKQLMILFHGVFCQAFILFKLCFILCVDRDAGYRIKIIQILGIVRCHLLAAA